MEQLFDLLKGDVGHQIIHGVSQETHQPSDKTAQVISMALPLLMGAMTRNAGSSDGAAGLLNALNSKHDGSILDDLGGFFQGGVSNDQLQDGASILGHILGGSQNNVVNALSKKSGMDTSNIMQILQVIAPIVLGYLGKQKQQQQVNSTDALGSLLGGLMGGQHGNQGLIEDLLDGNNDGSVIDDLAGMFLGGGNKKGKGGIGDLLGGMFGGR